ncbi:hypothetical protein OGH69_17315 [Flavobacterium sp. MFBS3-15]|uniref:hypothetical protein n=1 Tax=Flavobacterium sp. MFBS3-15 TaxID=2989816 RepID=UPI002236ADC8|nr:hypothetical protein [Flavobacterium sp. MFBS3-15]MCW4470735.1 hypothetical protein [Flavobacterium sp. MFBS3-15]
MKKFLSAYYNIWYIPVLTAAAVSIAGIFTLMIPYEAVAYLSTGLPFLALLVSFILGIIKLFKKQYLNGVLQFFFTALVSIIGIFAASIFMLFYPYDYYANNLEIPEDIDLNIPRDTLSLTCSDITDFEIGNEFQPGLYTYAFCYSTGENGIIYLKAFEINHEDPLSTKSLQQRSAISVVPSANVVRYQLDGHFSIFEGDWDHPYAARFELWFRNENGSERKLAEKIYKIEGWMR